MHRFSFPLFSALASALLALIFALIGFLFWQHDRSELEQGLAQESGALRTTFEVALSDLEQQMLTLASMVAADPEVQSLFRRGQEALAAEGGGPGGARTARLRDELYAQVAPAWIDMQQQFGLRQLHFQFGPGSLSYLRVHTPEKFGDRMDGLRHIIEDVNADQRPRTGFETGRIYSGVRGVVPVWYSGGGERKYVGALEAGTSFSAQLDRLDHQFGAGFAILLKQQHVEDAVWDQYRPLSGPRAEQGCGCYLEAASRDEVRGWMNDARLPKLAGDAILSNLLAEGDKTWHLTRFPLRDYLGKVDPARPTVGSVLVWRDKTAVIAAWQRHQVYTLLALLLAYLLAQGLLTWLLRTTRRGLQSRIDEATAALSVAGERLDMALRGADLGLWDWHIPSGRVTYNARWADMLGYTQDEITPHVSSWEKLVHPDDAPDIEAALQPHLKGETPLYESEHRMRHKNGHWIWILDRGKVMERAADGTPLRAVGTHLDITARRAAEARLRENEAMLRRAQSVARVGSWELDVASGRLDWSAETYRIFNLVPGTPTDYTLFLSFIHPDDRPHVDAAWQAALRGAPYDIEHRIVVEGETRWVREMAELATDAGGALVSALGTVQEITDLKQAEAALHEVSRRNELLLTAAGEGIYGVGLDGRTGFINPAALAMLGYAEHEIIGESQHDLFHHHHPDGSDYPEWECPLCLTLADGKPRRTDDEWFIRKDGSFFPVTLTVTPLEEHGRRTGAVAMFQDMTARRAAENALHAARARLATVIESFHGGILLEDQSRRVALVNQTFCDLFAVPAAPEVLIGSDCAASAEQVRHLLAQPDRFTRRIDEVIARRAAVIGEELNMADGRALERDYLPIVSGDAFLGHLWLYRDITERKERELELRRLATTDILTGLPNRRHFLERMEQELARFHRFGKSTALLMIDIDHFKLVNDRHGHAAGDAVLRHFAGLTLATLRKIDLIGRLGGEEFALILPGTDAEGAHLYAERLRRAVEEHACLAGAVEVPVTVSIGLTLFETSDIGTDLPLARADAALYQAKQEGRNRVEMG